MSCAAATSGRRRRGSRRGASVRFRLPSGRIEAAVGRGSCRSRRGRAARALVTVKYEQPRFVLLDLDLGWCERKTQRCSVERGFRVRAEELIVAMPPANCFVEKRDCKGAAAGGLGLR